MIASAWVTGIDPSATCSASRPGSLASFSSDDSRDCDIPSRRAASLCVCPVLTIRFAILRACWIRWAGVSRSRGKLLVLLLTSVGDPRRVLVTSRLGDHYSATPLLPWVRGRAPQDLHDG